MNKDGRDKVVSRDGYVVHKSRTVIESLVSGSLSSAVTTTLYQPLEVLKTRIQLKYNRDNPDNYRKLFGRTSRFAIKLVREQGASKLWTGTGASLLRSIPGVGFYYASLNILQTNFSVYHHKPDGPVQAFYFGLTARSIVSFVLLPVTVVKVRYESGQYQYSSLSYALSSAYKKSGWVGVAPTILRDSLFSGVYYMCYTKLKTYSLSHEDSTLSSEVAHNQSGASRTNRSMNFLSGLISGLIASVITNPLDVLKTNIQVDPTRSISMMQLGRRIIGEKYGYLRLFDGLIPRSIRRTLIAATTWTFYEIFTDSLRQRDC